MGIFDKLLGRGSKTKTKKRKSVKKKTSRAKKKARIPKMPEIDFENEALQDWSVMMSKVRSHPLSQAGIINSEVLSRIGQSLDSIDYKLNQLKDLEKLDRILDLLRSTKEEIESKGVSSAVLDSAIEEMEKLTSSDKTALEAIKKYGPISTEELAEKLKLSRSTVSTRANKLHLLGLIDKKMVGKEVRFEATKSD